MSAAYPGVASDDAANTNNVPTSLLPMKLPSDDGCANAASTRQGSLDRPNDRSVTLASRRSACGTACFQRADGRGHGLRQVAYQALRLTLDHHPNHRFGP